MRIVLIRWLKILVLLTWPAFTQAQDTLILRDTTIEVTMLDNWDPDYTFNDIWGYQSEDGSEYAITGTLDSTFFFDVTNPELMEKVAAKAGKDIDAIHRDYKTYKNYCYGVADEGRSSLQIFDLSYLPDSVPKVYDSDTLIERSHNIFINQGRLYATSNKTDSNFHPMTVLSLENPEKPKLLGHLDASPYSFKNVHDVYVRNDTAYCSNEGAGLFIFDYTDPAAPQLINAIQSYPQKGYNHSSWLSESGNFIVFADETHGLPLKVFDMSNLANIEFLNTFGSSVEEGSIPHNPFLRDSLAYVSYYHDGLQIFDLTNPEKPEKLASYDTYPQNDEGDFENFEGLWGVYPFLPSQTIIASDITNGLFTLRIDTTVNADTLIKNDEPFDAEVLPNPISDELKVNIEVFNADQFNVSIINTQGQVLYQRNKNLSQGKQQFRFNGLNNLPNGVYFAVIKTDDFSKEIRLLKTQ